MKSEAQQIIEFIERFKVTQGYNLGKNVELMPFQKRFIRGIWGNSKHNSNVSTGILTVARGAGKSTLLSFIILYFLLQSKIYGSEIVLVASSFSQGKIIFKNILRTLETQVSEELLRGRKRIFKINNTTQIASIENLKTKCEIVVLGSDSGRLFGRQPFLICADEAGAWIHTKSDLMHSALFTSLGKIPDSKLIAIGTKPSDPEHWFSKMLNSETTDYVQEHSISLDDKRSIHRKDVWLQANPSLKYFPDLLEQYKKHSEMAKSDPNMLASFKSLKLNCGIEDVAVLNYLISAETWSNCEVDFNEIERTGYLIFGIDLSGGSALSALSAYWTESCYLESVALVGDDPDLKTRGQKDNVGSLYERFYSEKSLILSRGKAADIDVLIETAIDRFGKPDLIVADRYKQNEFLDVLNRVGINAEISFRGMGFKDGSEDVERFRKACLTGQVKAKKQLLARHCFAGCRIICDPAGNEKISKNTAGGRRLRHRDDVAVSSVLAVAAGQRIKERIGKNDWSIIVV